MTTTIATRPKSTSLVPFDQLDWADVAACRCAIELHTMTIAALNTRLDSTEPFCADIARRTLTVIAAAIRDAGERQ